MKRGLGFRFFWTIALLVALSGSAWGHAALIAAEPRDGAVLSRAPDAAVLTFNEAVSVMRLSLIDPSGNAQVITNARAAGPRLEIGLPPSLIRGTHALSWRVLSEDGHPVGGAIVFSIGAPSAHSAATKLEASFSTQLAIWLARITLYAGLLLGVGASAFQTWGAGKITGSRIDRCRDAALALGAAAAVLLIGLQGVDALARDLGALVERDVWRTGLSTSVGPTMLLVMLAVCLASSARWAGEVAARALTLAAVACAGLAFAVSGHASTASPQTLMQPAVALHVTCASLWAGSLLPLLAAVRMNSPECRDMLLRFSAAAPIVVAMLCAAGLVLAFVQTGADVAFASTSYGKLLVAKLLLVAVVLALAAYNRFWLTSGVIAGHAAPRTALARSIAAELVLIVAIFTLTAAWRFTPPPRVAFAAPAFAGLEGHLHGPRIMGDVSSIPDRNSGASSLILRLWTHSGEPAALKEVKASIVLAETQMDPLYKAMEPQSDGTWRAPGLMLPGKGPWYMRATVLVSDFEQVEIEGLVTLKR